MAVVVEGEAAGAVNRKVALSSECELVGPVGHPGIDHEGLSASALAPESLGAHVLVFGQAGELVSIILGIPNGEQDASLGCGVDLDAQVAHRVPDDHQVRGQNIAALGHQGLPVQPAGIGGPATVPEVGVGPLLAPPVSGRLHEHGPVSDCLP